MEKMRLDSFLARNGSCKSREQARRLIEEGVVAVNGKLVSKASVLIKEEDQIVIGQSDVQKYVSRGGLKLEGALTAFSISLNGLCCMDIGASTGGFTDCMLQNGAKKVYCIDVGRSQLDSSLLGNPNIVNMEQVNIRNLEAKDIPDPIGFISVDVSFLSLEKVLPVMSEILQNSREAICLVKPQFEAGLAAIGKNGIVRSPKDHIRVLSNFSIWCLEQSFSLLNLHHSPIKGGSGNIEFLAHVRKTANPINMVTFRHIKAVVEAAHCL